MRWNTAPQAVIAPTGETYRSTVAAALATGRSVSTLQRVIRAGREGWRFADQTREGSG